MWAVGRRFSSPTKLGGQFSFPICATEREWRVPQPPHGDSVRKRIEMVTSAKVVEVLDGLQPYLWPDGAEAHPLRMLSSLSNADKHRSPHVVLSVLRLRPGAISGNQPNHTVKLALTGQGFHDNATIARLTITPDDEGVSIHANIDFQVRLDLKGSAANANVPDLLTYLHDFVRDTVFPQFKTAF